MGFEDARARASAFRRPRTFLSLSTPRTKNTRNAHHIGSQPHVLTKGSSSPCSKSFRPSH
ncbi:hypothetical protein JI435_411750 [Parastagonospora nodorum SN15]|uniref:Uncharacterized protein n=1 Tax=Phaeosphaeria nodorum (strain SN15 / ATCC MYA-4574 / FGSC 10173) TaxID=321614 RepID=A0A7U2F899_PHANO|nr:hypothetical protein HBI17_022700 [Parastagonospora nodorum]QRC98224.1 hypothetical protein JI435_411750 [Parastagonospora nodorum SN15]